MHKRVVFPGAVGLAMAAAGVIPRGRFPNSSAPEPKPLTASDRAALKRAEDKRKRKAAKNRALASVSEPPESSES